MNNRNIIAIVAAVVVVIGVIIWINSGSDGLAMEEQRSEQAEAARASDAEETTEADTTVSRDETTVDTDTAQSDAGTDSEAGTDTDSQAGAGGSDVDAASGRDPADLLTPENFEREEVLALIDESEELSDERRSTLRALVERASDDPEMVDEAINSIRVALDLPPLN
jgi:hypothetical protein